MVDPIRIGGDISKTEVRDIINRYFLNSKVGIKEIDYGERFEFIFSLEKKKPLEEITLYNSLANLAQDIIIEIYVNPIIKDRVAKICDDYSISEKKEIVASTHETLRDENYYISQKIIINDEIREYLIENNSLIIDGYMKFRLKKFLYVIDISIEKAIEDLETEKEYLEFLNMLQYFVEIQESRYELVNLIIKNGDYFILDMDNNIIEDGLLNDISEEISYENISRADLLISSLIIISPQKIIIHVEGDKEKELTNMISQIFQERVEYCTGCEKCRVASKLKKGK